MPDPPERRRNGREDAGKPRTAARLLMLTFGPWSHSCSRVRAAQYIPLLEATGKYRVHWLARVPERPRGGPARWLVFPLRKRWHSLRRTATLLFRPWDLVYVQRLYLPPWLLGWLRRRGTPIVYDFDDAIFLDPQGGRRNRRATAAMVRAATRVIVSSEELIPFCRELGAEPALITTPVDTDRLRPRGQDQDDGVFTIGWIGMPLSTPYLREAAPALTKLAAQRPFRLLLVGADPAFAPPGVAVVHEPWSFEREPELLRQMTVGIMPLPDTEWTRGKGGYKLFMYMAAGLPFVASPVGINQQIARHGENGFLAANETEWLRYLLQLCDDPVLRRRMGERGLKLVLSHYDRLACFHKLERCFEDALATPPGDRA